MFKINKSVPFLLCNKLCYIEDLGPKYNVPPISYMLPHVVFVIQPILVYFQLSETFE